MNDLKKYSFLIILLLIAISLNAQNKPDRYNLQLGEHYFITQVMKQNTVSDNRGMTGTVSLDIYSTIHMEVINITTQGNYLFSCFYSDLELSFFSPASSTSISSKSKAFHPIVTYLNELEEKIFLVEISPFGELEGIWDLDSTISSFYQLKSYKAAEDDIFIKTIKEGYGQEALSGILNMSLNIYCSDYIDICEKSTEVYFNAKMMNITNKLFYQTDANNKFRVQGIGTIAEDEDEVEAEGFSMKTIMNGDQSYDFLVDPQSGWIIEGISKQTIQIISIVENSYDSPKGLKIPSLSKSEYTLKGGLELYN